MTQYIVSPDGSGDFTTLAAAAKAVRPGDIVAIKPGVYRERLVANMAGVTWQAAAGAAAGSVVIDGEWNGRDIYPAPGQITVGAEGVVLRDLTVIRAAGDGIAVGRGGHESIIERCRVHGAASGGIILNPTGEVLRGVLVTECMISEAGSAWAVRRSGGVSGSLNIIRGEACVVRKTVVCYGWGEGINIGKGSRRCVVEACTVFDNAHLGIYFNRSQECEARNNVVFLTGYQPRQVGRADWPSGIIIGDEVGEKANQFDHSRANRIVNNLVVNAGTLIAVRNNAADDGYDTQIDEETLIAHNTLVAGPCTTKGINIVPNQVGRPHGRATIRDNAVHFEHAAAGGQIAAAPGGLNWQRNAWSRRPPAVVAGEEDIVGFQLSNPGAALGNAYPKATANISPDNYRPPADSPLLGAATNGGNVGAFGAAGDRPEDPPTDPPDEPEWFKGFRQQTAEALEALERVAAANATALAGQESELGQIGARVTTLERQMTYLAALPEG